MLLRVFGCREAFPAFPTSIFTHCNPSKLDLHVPGNLLHGDFYTIYYNRGVSGAL